MAIILIVQANGVNVINLFFQADAPLAFTLYVLTNIKHHQ
jgi:hypothetical protein